MLTGRQRHCNGGCDAEKSLLCVMKQKGPALIPRPLAGRSCPSCWLRALPSIMRSNERQGDSSSQALHGVYMDAMRPKSHAGSVSHPRLWDVRRGQSPQAVNPKETLNFRSLRPTLEAPFPRWEHLVLGMPCLILIHMQSS